MGNETQVALLVMPQLAEALDEEDDWTGLTDAAARRKRQNRLNVRAHRRRRKALAARQEELPSPVSSYHDTQAVEPPNIPCWLEEQQTVVLLPFTTAKTLYNLQTPLVPLPSARFSMFSLNSGSATRIMFPISSDHLISLIQFNVLRAAITNRLLVANLRPLVTEDTCSSVGLHILPVSHEIQDVPPSLLPTILQSTIPHRDWVESIPHPKWRDNVLLALGTFDEHQLWSDTIGGMFEGFPASEMEVRGLMVWKTPWDLSGWEVSEGFYLRWRFLFKGCSDTLVSTNKWRVLRGEEPLDFERLDVKADEMARCQAESVLVEVEV